MAGWKDREEKGSTLTILSDNLIGSDYTTCQAAVPGSCILSQTKGCFPLRESWHPGSLFFLDCMIPKNLHRQNSSLHFWCHLSLYPFLEPHQVLAVSLDSNTWCCIISPSSANSLHRGCLLPIPSVSLTSEGLSSFNSQLKCSLSCDAVIDLLQ